MPRGLNRSSLLIAADLRHLLGRAVAYQGFEFVEAAGVGGDIARICVQPSHNIRCSRPLNSITSVPGCSARCRSAISHGVGAPRVGDDDLHGRDSRASRPRCGETGPGAPRPCCCRHDEQALRMLQIVVAGRWGVSAQRLLVAGHRAAHAQARIRVEVVGADEPLGQLVEDVVVLGQQLARDVKAHGVGTVVADDPPNCVLPPGPARCQLMR
jgi:hypothetical protein